MHTALADVSTVEKMFQKYSEHRFDPSTRPLEGKDVAAMIQRVEGVTAALQGEDLSSFATDFERTVVANEGDRSDVCVVPYPTIPPIPPAPASSAAATGAWVTTMRISDAKVETTVTHLNQQLVRLQLENHRLQAKWEAAQQQASFLGQRVRELSDRIERGGGLATPGDPQAWLLEQRVADLTLALQQAELGWREAELQAAALAERVKSTSAPKQALVAENLRLSTELRERSTEIQKLRQALKTSDEAIELLQEEIAKLSRRLNKQQESDDHRSQQGEELQLRERELTHLEAQVELLTTLLAEERALRGNLEAANKDLGQQQTFLIAELTRFRSETDGGRGDRERQREALQRRLTQAETTADGLRQENQRLREERDGLYLARPSAEMSLQTLEAARGLLERELAAALDRLRGQDEQHRSALRVAAQAQEELQRKCEALQLQLTAEAALKADALGALAEKDASIALLQGQLDRLMADAVERDVALRGAEGRAAAAAARAKELEADLAWERTEGRQAVGRRQESIRFEETVLGRFEAVLAKVDATRGLEDGLRQQQALQHALEQQLWEAEHATMELRAQVHALEAEAQQQHQARERDVAQLQAALRGRDAERGAAVARLEEEQRRREGADLACAKAQQQAAELQALCTELTTSVDALRAELAATLPRMAELEAEAEHLRLQAALTDEELLALRGRLQDAEQHGRDLAEQLRGAQGREPRSELADVLQQLGAL
eukprot:EG_transcript_3585